jgi:hypothetical protein
MIAWSSSDSSNAKLDTAVGQLGRQQLFDPAEIVSHLGRGRVGRGICVNMR